jgi:MobA/MobL family
VGVAHLHFKRTAYHTGAKKASVRLEYITGKSEHAYEAAGQKLDYIGKTGREDVVITTSRNLPAWAQDNPYTYFQAAEQYERKASDRTDGKERHGIAFEEWKVTLPRELSVAQNTVLMDDLLDMIAGDVLPCTVAFHNPTTMAGAENQPHLHLLISARQNDEVVRTPEQHFRRYNREHPERGGAKKAETFREMGAVKAHRLMISDMLNIHLEQYGFTARVHPDTLESRGIEREAEPKLLPSESAAYRNKGIVGDTMAAVLSVRQSRGKTRTKEQNTAYQAWEERKAFLGIDRAMPREEKIAVILLKRHGTPAKVAARYQPHRDPDEERDIPDDALQKRWSIPILGNRVSKIYHLPTHANYGDVGPHNQVRFASEGEAIAAGYRRARNAYGVGSDKAMVARESTHSGRAARHTAQTRARSLAQQIAALTARLDGEEEAHGRGVRVRLWEKERDHGVEW